MKKRLIFLALIFIHISLMSFGQAKMIHYKSNQWSDVKNKGLDYAVDNPTYENVDIFQTNKFIKVVIGKNTFNCKIISSERFSSHRMDYNVILNGKKYVLSVCLSMATQSNGDFYYFIGIEGLWIIMNVVDVSNT